MSDAKLDEKVYPTNLDVYLSNVVTLIDSDGVTPMPVICVYMNRVEMHLFVMDAPDLVECVYELCEDEELTECIFALDCFTESSAGDGTTLDSCLTVTHCIRGQPARMGIVEYSWNLGNPTSLPINWDNEYWNKNHEGLTLAFTMLMCGGVVA